MEFGSRVNESLGGKAVLSASMGNCHILGIGHSPPSQPVAILEKPRPAAVGLGRCPPKNQTSVCFSARTTER